VRGSQARIALQHRLDQADTVELVGREELRAAIDILGNGRFVASWTLVDERRWCDRTRHSRNRGPWGYGFRRATGGGENDNGHRSTHETSDMHDSSRENRGAPAAAARSGAENTLPFIRD
jgi:hypothetical protein